MRDPVMCEALRELFKEEIQEGIQKAVQAAVKATVAVIKNLMDSQGWDAAKAMDNMGISPADQIRYAPML